jgi:hypothetical protein
MAMPMEDTGTRRAAVAPPSGWIGWLAWTGGLLSALLIVAVLVLTAASVVTRYLLAAPMRGIDEATGYLVVAIVNPALPRRCVAAIISRSTC